MRVDNLFFAYDKDDIIKGISFEIKDNKITTLMGANGCGKSTLFQLLTKNLKPREGSVFLDQRDIKDIRLKEFAQNVAIVHQYNTAPPDLPVHSLIAYGRIPFFKHFAKAQDKDKDKETKTKGLDSHGIGATTQDTLT